MDKKVREIILGALKESVSALKNNDVKLLKDISNRTMHSSSIMQDEHSITFSVLLYSLFKIYERTDYQKYETWYFFDSNIKTSLNLAFHKLKHNDDKGYDKVISDLLKSVDKLDKKLKDYVKDVISNAKISKASRLYEHGLSIRKTAELLGINSFELMEYVGKTGIADVAPSVGTIKNRLEKARSLFT